MFSASACSNCQQPPAEAGHLHPSCACGFARYCSPECRARHWEQVHGDACPLLQQLGLFTADLEPPPPDDDEGWLDYRRNQLMLATLLLGGGLPLAIQNSILWGQQVCSFCFTSRADLAVCPDCRSAAFCPQHEQQVLEAHRPVCELLAANQRCGHLIHSSVAQAGRPPTYLPAEHGDSCAAVSAGDGWCSGGSHDAGSCSGQPFPSSWPAFLKWRGCPASGWSDEERRCYTSALTWPVTLVHGLRLLRDVGAPLPASAPPPTLRLHLLGATMDCEAVCLAKYEEVLHCLPGVQRLELALVGPELPAAGQAPGQPVLCQDCCAKGRSMHITLHSCGYHKLVAQRQPPAPPKKSRQEVQASPSRSSFAFTFGDAPRKPAKPAGAAVSQNTFDPLANVPGAQPTTTAAASSSDAASVQDSSCGCSGSSTCGKHAEGSVSAASGAVKGAGTAAAAGTAGSKWEKPHAAFLFNSGLHEDNEQHQRSWLPTVRWLRDAGVPSLLTAYTLEEAQDDAAVLARLGCNIIIQPQKNCFANDVPMVDCEKRYKAFYVNGHLLAFHGKA